MLTDRLGVRHELNRSAYSVLPFTSALAKARVYVDDILHSYGNYVGRKMSNLGSLMACPNFVVGRCVLHVFVRVRGVLIEVSDYEK